MSTVPATDEESLLMTGPQPSPLLIPFNENNTNGNSTLGRGTLVSPTQGSRSTVKYGIDSLRYYDFCKTDDHGVDIRITDRNADGQLDYDERFGCPVDMKFISNFHFIILNLLFITTAFYIYNKLPNTAIVLPVLAFASIETILFAIYGGILNNLIFALPLTIGFVCTIGLIVSGGVYL